MRAEAAVAGLARPSLSVFDGLAVPSHRPQKCLGLDEAVHAADAARDPRNKSLNRATSPWGGVSGARACGLGQAKHWWYRTVVACRMAGAVSWPLLVLFSCQAVVAWPRTSFPPLARRVIDRVGCGPARVDAATCTQWAYEWCYGCACWQAPCSMHRTVDPSSSSISPRAVVVPRGRDRDPVLHT